MKNSNAVKYGTISLVLIVFSLLTVPFLESTGEAVRRYTFTCKDNDQNAQFPDGKNYFVSSDVVRILSRGNNFVSEKVFTDKCNRNNKKVFEYFCKGNKVKKVLKKCNLGCSNGPCIQPVTTPTPVQPTNPQPTNPTTPQPSPNPQPINPPNNQPPTGPICGDGIVNQQTEQCDGNDFNGQTCTTLGSAGGGNLGCTNMCNFDFSSCISRIPNVVLSGDEFFCEDPIKPNWVWELDRLNTPNPKLRIKNDFVKDDDTDNPAGLGDSYYLPKEQINEYLKIKFENLNVLPNMELPVTIEYSSGEDTAHSRHRYGRSSVGTIHIKAPGRDRFNILISNLDDINHSLPNNKLTSEVWLQVFPSQEVGIFFKDESHNPDMIYAGSFDLNNVGFRRFLEINFGETKDDNVVLAFNKIANDLVGIKVDIEGDTPIKLPDGKDDLYITFKHINNEFRSLGNQVSSEERDELWHETSTLGINYLGTKDENHRTRYGVIILNPKSNGAGDQVRLHIPNNQVEGLINIYQGNQLLFSEYVPLGKPIPQHFADLGIGNRNPTNGYTELNLQNSFEKLLVATANFGLQTSLTSTEDDYEDQIFLEIGKNNMIYDYNYNRQIRPSDNLNILNKQFTVDGINNNPYYLGIARQYNTQVIQHLIVSNLPSCP